MTTEEMTRLDSPIDVMYLLHKALRAEAVRVQEIASALTVGGSLEPLTQAFNRWYAALAYHAHAEDRHMTPPMADMQVARDNEAAHNKLEALLADLRTALHAAAHEAVGARTRRYLLGKVIVLRVAQDDHLEEEEDCVLPIIRRRISAAQQLEIARHLVIDQSAVVTRWIRDWISLELTATERQVLANLEACFAAA
jgi:hypothetical protein